MKNIFLGILLFGSAVWADFIRDDTAEIVTDTQKHLQWQDNNTRILPTGNWEKALKDCTSLQLGGFTDWRLPNINELISITNYSLQKDITQEVFRVTFKRYYWSSTTVVNSDANAWAINFGDGLSHNPHKSQAYHAIRCVRTAE